MNYHGHKLLIANRGEIAYRIIRTAKRIGLQTVAVYTTADAIAPHVQYADEAIPLNPEERDATLNNRGYLDGEEILGIAKRTGCTLVAPGYGFLSEDENFAASVVQAGLTWLGPRPETIRQMGLKHEARAVAISAGVPVVPGTDGLVQDIDAACKAAAEIGYPVMLKATGGGGGMGIVVCTNEVTLRNNFVKTQERAMSLFKNPGLFIERFVVESRHIEVQVFGNGLGHVIHMGERECSVQRRRQKLVEESPSPFMIKHPDIRNKMCKAAVQLCSSIKFASIGTCEFLVDNRTGDFFFLELNARIQVEHGVTEVVNPGLDLVELMIRQGVAQHSPQGLRGIDPVELDQTQFTEPQKAKHAIECRLYCENPSRDFRPASGVLQEVEWPNRPWLRVDTWVSRGSEITPFFDPLMAKLIASGESRKEAIEHMMDALTATKLHGPPNNVSYLQQVIDSTVFRTGEAMITYLDGFRYVPQAFEVIKPGLATSVQDTPGRLTGFGVPRSGAMDMVAHRAANLLVGNPMDMEALEITLFGPKILFHADSVVALTGADFELSVNAKRIDTWSAFLVLSGSTLEIRGCKSGYRGYLAFKGGFPEIPHYLGSKATSLGIGGYQGRNLAAGDQIALAPLAGTGSSIMKTISKDLLPEYPSDVTVFVTSGPYDDDEYLTAEGVEAFYDTPWKVSASSNRMGIRLEGGTVGWGRRDGGAGGGHPSNVLDNGYALGAVNMNGDFPVLLTCEGPSMGGFLCLCTVVDADLWKLGQLRPGSTVRFRRISLADARRLEEHVGVWLSSVQHNSETAVSLFDFQPSPDANPRVDPRLFQIANDGSGRPLVNFRQAGDRYLLIEYGEPELDLEVRARIHLFEEEVRKANISGVLALAPCVRSTLCSFDPHIINQSSILQKLVAIEESLPSSLTDVTFHGRLITLPIVLDDRWNQEAVNKYMRSSRSSASYLPSNVSYLAENNGLKGGREAALKALVSSDWVAVGVGFYLGCPFLVPVDPRARLTGQKYNPSRTFTPRGAIGIAGSVAAIYPVESPGGYQLYARTLPPWQTWGRGCDFEPEHPWLLRFFDQIRYEVITEDTYVELERSFDAGTYQFKIEDKPFSMREYQDFVMSVHEEAESFRKQQQRASAEMTKKEARMLAEWQRSQPHQHLSVETTEPISLAPGDGTAVLASMTAAVWKIHVQVGDFIRSIDDTIVTLEAMKTEIDVTVEEEEFIGKEVKVILVSEGQVVASGDPLILLG